MLKTRFFPESKGNLRLKTLLPKFQKLLKNQTLKLSTFCQHALYTGNVEKLSYLELIFELMSRMVAAVFPSSSMAFSTFVMEAMTVECDLSPNSLPMLSRG